MHLRTRPLGETLGEIAGSLLGVNSRQQMVRATEVSLTLPIEVKVGRDEASLVFCGDVPSWRWRTDWDLPFSEMRVRISEVATEVADEWR